MGIREVKTLISWCLLSVSLPALGQGWLTQFPIQQHSKYFDFYYRRNSDKVAAIDRFANEFINIVNRDFFKADFDYPIRTVVLEDRRTFQEFLLTELQISNFPAFGIYIPKQKMFATYEDSGLGTFAHEIMHPLVERDLKDRPMWAMEGIPTFFEKFYGYWTNDSLVVHWGYQNPWRIAELGTNLTQLDLEQIISNPYQPVEKQESALRMVSMFLWDQGKFKRFLQVIKSRDKAGFDSYFEAAMGKPLEQVVPMWREYLKRVAGKRSEIMQLPNSTIFPDKASFESFERTYKLLPSDEFGQ